jgi:small-conductance mechanosensitive channel
MSDEQMTQAVNDGATQTVAQSDTQAVEEQKHLDSDSEYVRQLRAEAAKNRNRLRELEKKIEADEEAKMTKQEQLQKRLTELERKEAEYQQTLQARTLEYEVKLQASQLGIEPDVAYRLIEPKQVEYDDDGKPTNILKILKDLVAKKSYLVASGGVMPSPTNPSQGRISGQQVFTRSQLRDGKFYAANRDAILQAMREGRITED